MKIRSLLPLITLSTLSLFGTLPSEPEELLTKSNNRFALSLLTQLESDKSNLLYSPYSLFTALSMVYTGSARETETCMHQALSLSVNQSQLTELFSQHLLLAERDSRLRIANSIWINHHLTLLPSFLNDLQSHFLTAAYPLDPQQAGKSAAEINRWIEDKTEKKITHLINESDITALTQLILANALYFKSSWSLPFSEQKTATERFYTAPHNSVAVSMMQQRSSFRYFENSDLQAVILPFKKESPDQKNLGCLILLPKEPFPEDSLQCEVSDGTTVCKLPVKWIPQADLIEKIVFEAVPSPVDLKLPKFTVEQKLSLKNALKALGMEKAFSQQADFSGMDGVGRLTIDNVQHSTFFSLDESGVEAAAATAIAMVSTTAYLPPLFHKPFIANHPFYFFLVDLDSSLIYFVGKMQTPLAE